VSYREEEVNNLLNALEPVGMLEASGVVATYLLGQCNEWQERFAAANKRSMEERGEPITPACPFFGGMLLALINVMMYRENQPHVMAVAEALGERLSPSAREWVRPRLNAVFDAMGFADDSHLLNWMQPKGGDQ
jgi:hypothetical protein